jgi:hypothetical protein
MEKQFRINKIYQTNSKTNPRRYIKIKGKRVYIDLPIGTPVKQVNDHIAKLCKEGKIKCREIGKQKPKRRAPAKKTGNIHNTARASVVINSGAPAPVHYYHPNPPSRLDDNIKQHLEHYRMLQHRQMQELMNKQSQSHQQREQEDHALADRLELDNLENQTMNTFTSNERGFTTPIAQPIASAAPKTKGVFRQLPLSERKPESKRGHSSASEHPKRSEQLDTVEFLRKRGVAEPADELDYLENPAFEETRLMDAQLADADRRAANLAEWEAANKKLIPEKIKYVQSQATPAKPSSASEALSLTVAAPDNEQYKIEKPQEGYPNDGTYIKTISKDRIKNALTLIQQAFKDDPNKAIQKLATATPAKSVHDIMKQVRSFPNNAQNNYIVDTILYGEYTDWKNVRALKKEQEALKIIRQRRQARGEIPFTDASGRGYQTGYGGVYSTEIIAHMAKIDGFIGCVPRDEMPKLLKYVQPNTKIGWIVNLDPHYMAGSHWCAIAINATPKEPDPYSVMYYDPFGRDIPDDMLKDLKVIANKISNRMLRFKINRVQQQGKTTETCGLHSMKFITDILSRDRSFAQATGYKDKIIDEHNKYEPEIDKLRKTEFKDVDMHGGADEAPVEAPKQEEPPKEEPSKVEKVATAVVNVVDKAEKVKSVIDSIIPPPRDVAPPRIRKFIEDHKDWTFESVQVCRAPIFSIIQKTINVLRKITFRKADPKYDKLFHLYMLITLKSPDGKSSGTWKMERNEVFNSLKIVYPHWNDAQIAAYKAGKSDRDVAILGIKRK